MSVTLDANALLGDEQFKLANMSASDDEDEEPTMQLADRGAENGRAAAAVEPHDGAIVDVPNSTVYS